MQYLREETPGLLSNRYTGNEIRMFSNVLGCRYLVCFKLRFYSSNIWTNPSVTISACNECKHAYLFMLIQLTKECKWINMSTWVHHVNGPDSAIQAISQKFLKGLMAKNK